MFSFLYDNFSLNRRLAFPKINLNTIFTNVNLKTQFSLRCLFFQGLDFLSFCLPVIVKKAILSLFYLMNYFPFKKKMLCHEIVGTVLNVLWQNVQTNIFAVVKIRYILGVF